MSVLLAGCLDFKERITVHENGQVLLEVEVRNLDRDAIPLLALPHAPDWQVVMDIDPDDPSRKILTATTVVPPGAALPSSYADSSQAFAAQQLQFPTRLRTWTRDGITFYEFVRTYPPRRISRFLGDVTFDEELEQRVLNDGIFAVNEEDRRKYLASLTQQARHLFGSYLEEALGSLLLEGQINLAEHDEVLEKGREVVTETFGPEKVLEILSQDDEGMAEALELTTANLFSEFTRILQTLKPEAEGIFRSALDEVTTEYNLSNRIGNHQFQVEISLPGKVVSTNGQPSAAAPGTVHWRFEGKDLLDRGIELRAVSALGEGEQHDSP